MFYLTVTEEIFLFDLMLFCYFLQLPAQEIEKSNGEAPKKIVHNNQIKTKPKAPPPPPPTKNSVPPPCPSPDYDTISINSNNSTHLNITPKKLMNGIKQNGIKTSQNLNDSVEMESIESFKLNQPTNLKPKPPNTYFNKPKPPLTSQLSNGSITSNSTLKKARPVSVTIGEYPSGTSRKQPTRFDFLPNGNNDRLDGSSISSQLATELAQTLNRSNLKKRTESMVSQIKLTIVIYFFY